MRAHKGIKIYDNGGEIFDRYTVIIDGEMYAMSEAPLSPQGFNQYVGKYEKPWGDKLVSFESLPQDVRRAILNRMEEIIID
ncbi:MAG: hypothetical protein KAR06_04285 [Deltaproteobacteria bacterium]|nr:hypothetical protein [Deltaproteobacteria bacterium]